MNQGVASEPFTFSNLEAENAAAVGARWADEKCSSVAFFSMRGRGVECACVISYGQNLVVLGFCQESVFSKGVQFGLVECILKTKSVECLFK